MVLEEILVANGSAILMMAFLLLCRIKNRESMHAEDRIYDGMALLNLCGALVETISFLIDGQEFAGGRFLNYLTNTLCFVCTVSIACLWCAYVDLRIYRSYKSLRHKIIVIMIPWLVEMAFLACNLFGTGIMFRISADNVYHRGSLVVIGYISLIIYFAYSVCLVYRSKRQGINLYFFPVLYFVGPCLAGVLIQLFNYGLSTSWLSVAIAMLFVQMQVYSEFLNMDELSGLYNRRYMNGVIAKYPHGGSGKNSLYGIMLDINDFKQINDNYGHNVGDQAIRTMGEILYKSVPDGGIAIRYAGDEFVVLLLHADRECLERTVEEIRNKLAIFNASGQAQYALHVAIGYAEYMGRDDEDAFFSRMDANMYAEKRRYHQEKCKQSDRIG